MTSIKYTPVTGGRTFGDPGSLFDSAARSLGRATEGASDAFGTFRQGAIDAKDVRTQDAITAIQSAQTPEQLQQLSTTLTSPDAFIQEYGDIDTNAAIAALRGQDQVVQDKAASIFANQQAANTRADAPLIQEFKANLQGLSADELRNIYQGGEIQLPTPFSDPTLAKDLVGQTLQTQQAFEDSNTARTLTSTKKAQESSLEQFYVQNPGASRQDLLKFSIDNGISSEISEKIINRINRQTGQDVRDKTAIQIAKEGREETRTAKKQALKDREDILNIFDTTDDRLGILDSSRVEAEKAIAALQELGVAESQINILLRKSKGGEDDFEPTTVRDFVTKLEQTNKLLSKQLRPIGLVE